RGFRSIKARGDPFSSSSTRLAGRVPIPSSLACGVYRLFVTARLSAVDAAVDVERRAGDEAAVFGGQEQHGARDVLGVATAAERNAAHRFVGGLFGGV